MAVTRREFLAGAGGVAGLSALGGLVGVAGPAFGAAPVDPATAVRNRLVVVFLEGGNDGLNFVVPRGDVAGAPRLSVYRRVRPTIGYGPSVLLPLDRGDDDGQQLGFNPKMSFLHRIYRDGRVAIVQGVDYPNHSYSHFASEDIWHTGDPDKRGTSGWIGRHLDRAGIGEGELRAVAVASKVPLMLQGRLPGAALPSIDAMRFRDGTSATALERHAALAAMGAARPGDPLRQRVGASVRQAVDVVTDLARTEPPAAATSAIANSLLTARALLEHDLGVECVYVSQHGYDTHTTQVGTHAALLTELDAALDGFFQMRADVASRTLVMIVSEFGRRMGEANGGLGVAGTDHGAAGPVVLIGPPAAQPGSATLVPGLHGAHPNMGTTVAPADNLTMTTDVRHVYQSVLERWLGDPDPRYKAVDATPLRGLITAPPGVAGGSGGGRSRISVTTPEASVGLGDDDATTTTGVGRRGVTRLAGGRGADADKSGIHPVSGVAALAFNAFVAALVVRSGRFREALDAWRARSL